MLWSHAMQRHLHVWCYGHWGEPFVVFPSAAGMAHEWEAQGMVGALSDLIEAGRLKLYCTESNVSEAWTDRSAPADWRIGRHRAYECYVLDDLVAFVRDDCRTPGMRMGLSGCSLGAFYAATFALKHPEIFHYALCMSGRYEATAFTGGWSNQEIYFNNPLAFVANLEGDALERVRRETRLALVCGRGPWEEGCIDETEALADLLAVKGIGHERDIWGHDSAHEWIWWQRQARHHLGRLVGG
jgi:esterase/lipase superfamily enzyme